MPDVWEAEVARILAVTETIIRQSMVDLATLMVANTPMETGLARGSWRVGIDGPTDEQGTQDPSGSSSVAAIRAKMQEWHLGQEIFLLNTAKNSDGEAYIYFVEFGTVRIRPRGFIRLTLGEFPRILAVNAEKYGASGSVV